MQDMAAKGRHGHTGGDGESNSQAKLTNADIVEIRKLSADGVSQRKIAKQFGVNQTGISAIVTRKRWSHVP